MDVGSVRIETLVVIVLLLSVIGRNTSTRKRKGSTVDTRVINDGSATIDDYAKFFAAFGVALYKTDGTYKTVKEANEKLRGS